MWQLGEYPDGP
jgi:hypothetical protein